MNKMITLVISIILSLAVGGAIGYVARKILSSSKVKNSEKEARMLLTDAERQASSIKKEALVEAKDEIYNMRLEAEKDIREKRSELQKLENRLLQKEEVLEERFIKIDQREKQVVFLEKENARLQNEL